MAQCVMGDPVPESKMEESPEKSNGLSLSSPVSPLKSLLDADVAKFLSRPSPPKNKGIKQSIEYEYGGNTQQDLNSSEGLSTSLSAEKKPDNESVLENPDSNAPVKSSTVLSDDKDPSSESIQQNMNTNIQNGSTTLSKETESLDKDTGPDAVSNVPLFCLTIREGTESSYGKEIETETIVLDNYRDEKEIDSEDSSDSTDSSSDCSDSFLYEMRKSVKYVPAPKTYNVKPEEITYGDLPPLENLDINVEESEVKVIGIVQSIVGLEAVIKTRGGLKPLQLNSVLFLSNQIPLGKVCDVYGPVKQPYYSVRFKSKEHLENVGVAAGMEVFFAPERTEITEYVFPEELQKLKGSDASGRNDNEPSDDNLDFSDDEKEQEARLRRKRLRQAARERDFRYETTWTNQQERDPGASESNANPFYSMNNVSPQRQNWNPHRSTTTSSNFSNTPRQQFQRSSNFAQTGNSYLPQRHAPTPPASNYRQEASYQSLPSPFQPPYSQPDQSPFQLPYSQPDQSPFQPPSPLVQLQFRTQPPGGPIPFPPPSPLPYQQISSQRMGYSQQFVQQQQQPPIGPPRPISLQQMHMFGQMTPLGPLSPAPVLHFTPPTIASPPPSTAFPPASPNFSYFSHPFPSAPSPAPRVSHQSYRAPPSPGGMQVMPPMSPLSIQIPNTVRSPPSTMMANGYNYQGNRNLLQQNVGFYGQRY